MVSRSRSGFPATELLDGVDAGHLEQVGVFGTDPLDPHEVGAVHPSEDRSLREIGVLRELLATRASRGDPQEGLGGTHPRLSKFGGLPLAHTTDRRDRRHHPVLSRMTTVRTPSAQRAYRRAGPCRQTINLAALREGRRHRGSGVAPRRSNQTSLTPSGWPSRTSRRSTSRSSPRNRDQRSRPITIGHPRAYRYLGTAARGPGLHLRGDEGCDHLRLDSRLIAVRDDGTFDPAVARQRVEADPERRSQPLAPIEIKHEQGVAEIGAVRDLFTVRAHDHDHVVDRPRGDLVDDQFDERLAAENFQVLRSAEPDAGVDGEYQRSSSGHRSSRWQWSVR